MCIDHCVCVWGGGEWGGVSSCIYRLVIYFHVCSCTAVFMYAFVQLFKVLMYNVFCVHCLCYSTCMNEIFYTEI